MKQTLLNTGRILLKILSAKFLHRSVGYTLSAYLIVTGTLNTVAFAGRAAQKAIDVTPLVVDVRTIFEKPEVAHAQETLTIDSSREEKKKALDETCAEVAPGDKACSCILDNVFYHDSKWATAGVGRKVNNPGNMRVPGTWTPSVPFTVYKSPGNGVFSKFETLRDGIRANVELYARHYAGLSKARFMSKWVAGGGNAGYRAGVFSCFK